MSRTNNPEINKQRFLESAKEKFGDKFDYSQFEYVTKKTKSTIICKEHGPFEQSADKHLQCKVACPVCTAIYKESYRPRHGVKKEPVSKEAYLERVTEKYGDKYTYDMSEYKGITNGIVTLICPKHGPSEYVPRSLLISKYGCMDCSFENRNKTKTMPYQNFLEIANQKHNSFYTYPETNESVYENRKSIVDIVCPKHGPFKKKAQKHLAGQGCFDCKIEHLVETGVLIGGYKKGVVIKDPELANRDSLVYYMKIGDYYKIGITTNLSGRIRCLKNISKANVEVLQTVELSLIKSIELESMILEIYKDHRVRTDWSTELFSENVLEGKLLSEI